jgi:hypothetical protein
VGEEEEEDKVMAMEETKEADEPLSYNKTANPKYNKFMDILIGEGDQLKDPNFELMRGLNQDIQELTKKSDQINQSFTERTSTTKRVSTPKKFGGIPRP